MKKNYIAILLIHIVMLGGCNSVTQPIDENSTYGDTPRIPRLGFTKKQRDIADQFVSVFENGTTKIQYGYAEDIGDDRGITAGRSGFTSATGDMLYVIEKYTKEEKENLLAPYRKELKRLEKLRYEQNDKSASASTDNLKGLVAAWKKSAKDLRFREIQDEVTDELYYIPALNQAKKIGLKYPVCILAFYDTNIMHGMDGLMEIIEHTNGETNNITPKDGFDEVLWIEKFNKNRLKVMNEPKNKPWKESTARVKELQDLINNNNLHLRPFKMIIESYENEVFELGTE